MKKKCCFEQKKSLISLILLGLSGFFSYLYIVNNSKYMPKNKLFKSQDYTSKNYSFYFTMHFIFQNASKFHFETIPSNLFAAQSINKQKTAGQKLELQS